MYVYILSNSHKTVFYTGVTNNIFRRMFEHKSGLIEGFSKKYHCSLLLWYRELSGETDAITFEKSLKKYSRSAKLKLITKDNPDLNDLAKDWDFGDLTVPLEYTQFPGMH